MSPENPRRLGEPSTWLESAREDLALAAADVPGVGFGIRCFHAQQAGEKAIKAVLIARAAPFPYVHDLGRLLQIAAAPGSAEIPPEVADADLLTDFATLARYPGAAELERGDLDQAVGTARAVLSWAEAELHKKTLEMAT
jgi:HEPN domain-containing protein